MHTITFGSSKGGVGKSTACICIAGALLKQGHSVAVIDYDQNQTLKRWYDTFKPRIDGLTVYMGEKDNFERQIDQITKLGPEFLLLDIAGAMEQTILQAMNVTDIVISPALPSEPDLREAVKVRQAVNAYNRRAKFQVQHRLLINQADSLDTNAQRHTLAAIADSDLIRFDNLMHRRTAYREIYLNGLLPHFADTGRDPIRKAISEIDKITMELTNLIDTTKKALAS